MPYYHYVPEDEQDLHILLLRCPCGPLVEGETVMHQAGRLPKIESAVFKGPSNEENRTASFDCGATHPDVLCRAMDCVRCAAKRRGSA